MIVAGVGAAVAAVASHEAKLARYVFGLAALLAVLALAGVGVRAEGEERV